MKINIEKLKRYQLRACMSVTDISRASGISRATLYRMMYGKTEPTLKTVAKIGKALKMSQEEILNLVL